MRAPHTKARRAIKLPSLTRKPKSKDAFKFLSPGGDEVYKVKQRYPTLTGQRRCKIHILWTGGPYPRQLLLALIDMKHWSTAAMLPGPFPNVPPGKVGHRQWKIPAKFQPTDDCPTGGNVQKAGRYCIYIADAEQYPPEVWKYGPEFTIVWSE